jgi:hypothetical protein
MAQRAYESVYHSLEDEVAPSKPYFERLIAMLSTCYTAEELTTVTTVQQEIDGNAGVGSEADARGYLRITAKTLAVVMPKTSELYRLRLRTQAYAWNYLRMRFSNVAVLATITPERCAEFQEYLFGPQVWGMATRDENGRVTSTPTILQVQNYEKEIRKDVARRLNRQQDWWTAMQEASACPRLLQVHFLSPVAKDHRSSVTAPGIAPFQTGSASSAQPKVEKRAIEGQVSDKAAANRLKRQRKNANYKALKDAAARPPPAPHQQQRPGGQQLAIVDAPRRAKGTGKEARGGIASKFPAGAHQKSAPPESKGICVNFNLLGECKRSGCYFAHACWWCLDTSHSGATCPKKVLGA